ncbi:hypothetical protein Cni_G05759 [Canna indica]|uniref:Reverse transcriptase n=1 Tax=Canna indica TaxID=4628 RepID=A0AAQ3JVT0_9LILI|nr:hypothetical protein Cni_G05759 [Canna indica]
MKYLGASISPKKLSKSHQEAMVHKAMARIDGWAGKEISRAGKMVLLNSVMRSLPMHTLSSSWINEGVIDKFQGLARSYLWSFKGKKKRFHLIGWNKVLLRKNSGGLGVKDLGIMRHSIHAKRILPFLNKERNIWSKMLLNKYDGYHPWYPKSNKSFSRSFKCIHNAIQMLKEGLRVRIGNGTRVDMWKDPWLSNLPINLWSTYLNMEIISRFNRVSQLIKNNSWDYDSILDLFGEHHLINFDLMYLPKRKTKDKWVWSVNEELSCKVTYNYLAEKQFKTEENKVS